MQDGRGGGRGGESRGLVCCCSAVMGAVLALGMQELLVYGKVGVRWLSGSRDACCSAWFETAYSRARTGEAGVNRMITGVRVSCCMTAILHGGRPPGAVPGGEAHLRNVPEQDHVGQGIAV